MAQTVLVSPHSIVYSDTTNGNTYPGIYVGALNSRRFEGSHVVASLAADSNIDLHFAIPATLAATTNATFRAKMVAAATLGAAKYVVSYVPVAAGSNYDTAAFTDSATQTATAAVSDGFLDTDTPITVAQADAGKVLVVRLGFKTALWTLAVKSAWQFFLKIDVA